MKGLFGLLSESALNYPDRPFIRRLDKVWTYCEALSLAQRVAENLRVGGIQKGDRVALFCGNSMQYVAAFFGILRSGAVAVPINPAKMTESIFYIVEKCAPTRLLLCDATVKLLSTIEDRICSLGIVIQNIDHLGIFDANPNGIGDEEQDWAADEVDEDSIAEILFTSGTTANPKGVTLTHGNLMANTEAIVTYLHLTFEDSILMTLPFSYSYGNSILLTHVFVGAAIIIEDSAAFPYRVLEGIKKHKVSGFSTVGSYANLLLKCLANSDEDKGFLNSLRYITFAGEATSADDICFIKDKLPHIKVYVMYGQTEAGARLSYLDPEDLGSKLGSIGKGLCNIELRVVDENGMQVKPGEIGEIIARGPSIMKGYWEDPASTEEVLKNGWLYTGDFAVLDEDGYIYVKGRKSDIIKHMGHRISPVEIENVINRCGYIKECAVVEGVVDRIPVIKAYIVPSEECQVDEVRGFANSRLPAYMRPQVFEVISQLPKTDSGKIMRSCLRGL